MIDFPCLGVTVTLSLHDPAFRAFTDVPTFLQYVDEPFWMLTVTRDPLRTFSFADDAIALFDFIFPTPITTDVEETGETPAAVGTGVAIDEGEPFDIPLHDGELLLVPPDAEISMSCCTEYSLYVPVANNVYLNAQIPAVDSVRTLPRE